MENRISHLFTPLTTYLRTSTKTLMCEVCIRSDKKARTLHKRYSTKDFSIKKNNKLVLKSMNALSRSGRVFVSPLNVH